MREIGELAAGELQERVDQLVSAVQDTEADFAQTASIATGIGELAERIAAMYGDVEQTLARGFEDEQKVTKEELLVRAREADIEGRSSMTKEQLREALDDAGA